MSSEVERRDGCKYLFIVFLQSGLPSNHICIDPICTCCCYLRIWPLVTPTLLCSACTVSCTQVVHMHKKSMLSLYNVPSELVVWVAASIVGHCVRAIICTIIILSCSFMKEETAQDKKVYSGASNPTRNFSTTSNPKWAMQARFRVCQRWVSQTVVFSSQSFQQLHTYSVHLVLLMSTLGRIPCCLFSPVSSFWMACKTLTTCPATNPSL